MYRRKQKRPDGSVYEGRTWWLKFYQHGRAVRESTGTSKETVARRILRVREGDVERGVLVQPKMGLVTFAEAAQDLLNDYATNKKRSHEDTTRRVELHLRPFFKWKRLTEIDTALIRAYITHRQAQGAANATINRELAALRRMFSLACQAQKLASKPHFPMLREDNTRTGFFEPEQFQAVKAHLPLALRPVAQFAYITGWRLTSEILPLEWRHVDWNARQVRLDPGTTKSGDGRSFPFTAALEALLTAQWAEHEQLKVGPEKKDVPYVFHRAGERIKSVRGAWETARAEAGCPTRILHDFRRTSVRNLELASVPRSAAMAMVGHKTESIYRRYAIVDSGALKDAARRIDDAAGTISGTKPKARQKSQNRR